jgi:hypothetical protein
MMVVDAMKVVYMSIAPKEDRAAALGLHGGAGGVALLRVEAGVAAPRARWW